MMVYDILIKNGTLVDPGAGMNQKADLGINGDKIAFIGKSNKSSKASKVIDAEGRIVTPGLIDMHVHVYPGVSHYGIEPDPYCLNKGVTTAVDAGSAGAWTFPALRRHIIDKSGTRLLAFLNISSTGMVAPEVGELEDIRYANVQKAIEICKAHKDVIIGIKVRLSKSYAANNVMEGLKRAIDAADAMGLPVMVHPGNTLTSIDHILSVMRKGDILTHCYHGHPEGILDEKGNVKQSVRKAIERGVLLDVGHGQGSFTFEVGTKAIAQGVLPHFISSDIHFYNTEGPVYDLATTVSKFIYMGISLDKVLEMCITRPARFLKLENEIGTLKVGAKADIAIMEFAEGRFELVDCNGEKRVSERCLIPKGVVRDGECLNLDLHDSRI
jgi:dihydroorotase